MVARTSNTRNGIPKDVSSRLEEGSKKSSTAYQVLLREIATGTYRYPKYAGNAARDD
jgi:hypothetical protein